MRQASGVRVDVSYSSTPRNQFHLRPPPMASRSRWSALAASALIQCFAGSSYCFAVYSPALKASQSYDQSALDKVAFFKDVGANAGILSGLLAAWAPAGRRRPWLVLLAAQAQTFLNTADVVTAVENFPDRRGTVIGIMKVNYPFP